MAIQGVNLGGWLVPERWMTPSIFDGPVLDIRKAQGHFAHFITTADIAWLADHGVKMLRIPVPYADVFKFLDPIVRAAYAHGMQVLIDLHAAPGSQNGWEHSGGTGEPHWHTSPNYISQTLDAIEAIAKHYVHTPGIWGIEVLNEPRWDIPHDVLAQYYQRAYQRIRKYSLGMWVVFSDAFRPGEWRGAFPAEYKNIALDLHLYQCFSPEDKALGLDGHVQKARVEWAQLITGIQKEVPVIVGEWSLGLDVPGANAARQYGRAQQQAFAPALAQFYWSYKTEQPDNWNFRNCVETGVLRLQQADN